MFKRILKSSRVQTAFVGFIAAIVVAGWGWTDEQSGRLTEILLWLIGGITTALVGGTALEDAAQKRAGVTIDRETKNERTDTDSDRGKPGPSIPRPANWGRGVPNDTAKLLMLLVLPLTCIGMAGCSTLDPGGQTKAGLGQRSQFLWDERSNFVSDIDGTQTGRFTMAEGQIVLKEDGAVDPAQSAITHYLHYEPKADAARDAFAMAYQQSTLQMQMQLETFKETMLMVRSMVPLGGVSVEASGQVDVREPRAVQRDAD